jgi:hypothetical protein
MPRKGKAAELARWIAERRPSQVGEAEFAELARELAPVSDSYLRKLVKECGVPLAPLVAGVRQGNLDELEESLRHLLQEYDHGDAKHRASVRRLVITAKDHARLAARNPARRAEKEEVILWLTTWLENPRLFPVWVEIRRSLLDGLLRH